MLGYAIPPNLETVIMNPRLTASAALLRELAIPASVCVWLVAFGSGAAPIVDRLVPALAADASFADKPKPVAVTAAKAEALSKPLTEAAVAEATPALQAANVSSAEEPRPIVVASADIGSISTPVTEPTVAADATPASQGATTPAAREPEPIVTAALTDSSEMLPPVIPLEPAAKTTTAMLEPEPALPEPEQVNRGVDSTAVLDECLVAENCIDRYLWALYQRTPKEDAIKVSEQRRVTVKKKGKLVSVTRTFSRTADEDFSWKDPKAADHFGMAMTDYVIGGMDRDFKLRLFHMLHVAEAAGLSPGITSAFRDDYRQSIASGLKAADNRSYHGGSLRGGYGHGLAADIVSVNGATRTQRLAASETLWKWVDTHGKEFGIGRPYLGRDPPHVAPIDGQEYAKHHPGMKVRQAAAAGKPHKGLASHDDRSTTKRARAAASSRARTIS
jgi:hypothetical protein